MGLTYVLNMSYSLSNIPRIWDVDTSFSIIGMVFIFVGAARKQMTSIRSPFYTNTKGFVHANFSNN